MCAMSPRLLRPIAGGIHPEAAAWRSAVIANGGSVSGSTLNAVSKFCRSIDLAGIRDRFYRLNLFAGTGLNAALVPLYRGTTYGGTTYGTATDTNNGPFVSGDFSESSGLKGDGLTKSLDTTLPLNSYDLASSHIGLSFTELEASGDRGLLTINGLVDGANSFATFQASATTLNGFHCSFTPLTTTRTTAESHLLLSRTSTASAKLYTGGTVAGTLTETVTTASSSATYRVFGRQDAVNFILRTGMRLRMYSLGLGLDDAQAASLSSAVATLNTALGRA